MKIDFMSSLSKRKRVPYFNHWIRMAILIKLKHLEELHLTQG
jgi:hypothetical protein